LRQSSRNLILAALVTALLLAWYIMAHAPQPSDQQQITDSIQGVRDAAVRGDISGIMHYVSADYQDSNVNNVDQLHFLLLRHNRDMAGLTVALSAPAVTVTGDTASSQVQVTATDPATGSTQFDRTVTLTWKRESGVRDLVIPTKVWRIASADYGSVGGD
jgi:FlaG/FlaF family flagellin (archaellin)